MTDGNVVRSDAPGGLSRRTLVAGAAWSVPVVVGLAAVPAYAASIGGIKIQNLAAWRQADGLLNGNFGIQLDWDAPAGAITATVTIAKGGVSQTITDVSPASPVTLAPDQSQAFTFSKGGLSGTYTVTLVVTGKATGSTKTFTPVSTTYTVTI
jgi:hypothetical protein